MLTIVDYQMGNLRSVQKALERLGHPAQISSDPHEIAAAERLILPGVGGFPEAMQEIRQRDLVSPIKDFVATGKPFLGICLGLQLLFETGYEGGTHQGLGILPGEVIRFERSAPYKVPHMGWNTARICKAAPILEGIPDESHFYFVHSYYVVPEDSSIVALECDYGGTFCAMVWKDNLMATQFHPEKSQQTGLKLLANFASLPITVCK